MGSTIWEALADTYPNFKREDWTLDHETDQGAVVSYTLEPVTTLYISRSLTVLYTVILEE